MDRTRKCLLTLCVLCLGTAVPAASQPADASLASKTRKLDEQTQSLKREVLELGRNIAYLAWVGGVKPVGDPTQSGKTRYNLKALSDETVHMGQTLALLEDGVLSPPGFQLVVFTSLEAKEDFDLEEITLKIDDKMVMRRKYSDEETAALRQGGAHRLYIGDLPDGQHQLTVYAIGRRGEKKRQQENTTIKFNKVHERKTIELRLTSFMGGMRINPKEWD